MNALFVMLLIPVVAAGVLALLRPWHLAAGVNVGASALGLACTAWLGWQVAAHGVVSGAGFHVDGFSMALVALTAFVGLTTAVFSRTYMRQLYDSGTVAATRMRLYHAMYQLFMFTMLLALTTDNLGVLWVAVEGATLATVLLVSLYRTSESIEAAWKYFVLCSVGIALALFGTVLTYFAAGHLGAAAVPGLSMSALHEHAAGLQPSVMSLAFVFLLVGYGTKAGLVPMHQWLPDAHSEGPAPMSAMLSGLLLNVALYAIVRVKLLVDGSLASSSNPYLAGQLLMGFGLVSFLVAAFFLHRQRDIKRLFSYSSVEHMGIVTFAFGLGGPIATFGALLHMLSHSLAKSAIFVTVGYAARIAGSQGLEHIRGLIRTQPAVGWSLVAGVAAIAGLPPFGIFAGEFLLLVATVDTRPWLAVVLLAGLVVAFAGLFRHLQPVVFGAAPEGQRPVRAAMAPVLLHLGLAAWFGLAMPGVLAGWLHGATFLISGDTLP